jgi:hypothetical protein
MVSIQPKAAIIGSAVITTAIAIILLSSSMTRLASSSCRFFFSAMKLLPVGGGNLGAPLSRHSGDNFTQVSCHSILLIIFVCFKITFSFGVER